MRNFVANPNYADIRNAEYWQVIGTQDHASSVADYTTLSVGSPTLSVTDYSNVSHPTGTIAVNVDDLGRLMKGWTTLTYQSIGSRNTVSETYSKNAPYFPIGEPFIWVDDIGGFSANDNFALLEGLKPGNAPYSSAATSSDYGMSQWSFVRNAGLLVTNSLNDTGSQYASYSSFCVLESSGNIGSRVTAQDGFDNYNPWGYGTGASSVSTYVPTPDNVGNGTIGNWYVIASGDSQSQANITQFLPDFTTTGQSVNSVQIGQTQTTITFASTPTGLTAGQTVTIAMNGSLFVQYNPSNPTPPSAYNNANTAAGWFAGKITSITGTTVYTDLNATTAANTSKALPGSFNATGITSGSVAFGATGVTGNTFQISVTSLSSTANYGLAVGQTVTQVSGATFTTAIITAVSGVGVGTILTLNTAQSTGTTFSLSASFTDTRPVAYAATIGNSPTFRINHNANQYTAQFVTTPYFSTPTPIILSSALSTTGSITSISVYAQGDAYGGAGETIAVVNGNNYQEFVASSAFSISSGTTGSIAITSATPTYAFPANSAVYTVSFDQYSRYGFDLIIPCKVTNYSSEPVATFKSMVATTGYSTITTSDGSSYSWGSTFSYTPTPYIVTVDDVSGINVGDTLTFRSEYNGWYANHSMYGTGTTFNVLYSPVGQTSWSDFTGGDTSSGNAYPLTWDTVNVQNGLGITISTTSGSPTITVGGGQTDNLPLAVGQQITGTNIPTGTTVKSWTNSMTGASSTTITLSANATGTITGSTAAYSFFPGVSNYFQWLVLDKDPTNNTFVVATSSTLYTYTNTLYPNGDSQNAIYKYDPFLYAGNTLDVIDGTTSGPGVVGLYRDTSRTDNPNSAVSLGRVQPEPTIQWHDATSVVGSYSPLLHGKWDTSKYAKYKNGSISSSTVTTQGYFTGFSSPDRSLYIGSQSVGDQETITPWFLGTLVGSTLALDVSANGSTQAIVSPLPNTANAGTMSLAGGTQASDYNQYKNATRDFTSYAQWAGFANIGSVYAYNDAGNPSISGSFLQGISSPYETNDRVMAVVGLGETQEMVTLVRAKPDTNSAIYGETVDGSNNSNIPIVWNLDTNQTFQYDHDAGEPIFMPNVIYQKVSDTSHAKGAPMLGTPDYGTVYDGTNTSYTATPGLVATNPSSQLSVNTDAYLTMNSPWLQSGNNGNANISTTLASSAGVGATNITLTSSDNFPASYPSLLPSGINYLPPNLGRLAGDHNYGVTTISLVPMTKLPSNFPFFIRLGAEVLQVTGLTTASVGGNTLTALTLATATTASHPDFTPVHLNSVNTDTQYQQISIPSFYLADATATGTLSYGNTILGTSPSIGNGQTVTGTGIPVSTTVTDHSSAGIIAISNSFTSTVSATTITNSYTYASPNLAGNPAVLTGLTSFAAAGSTCPTPTITTLPGKSSVITGGTYIAASTLLSSWDNTLPYLRLTMNKLPAALVSTLQTITSTFYFTAQTYTGNNVVTVKNIGGTNGTLYSKVGTNNPTWGGQTLDYYLKVGTPISTSTGGTGLGTARYIVSVNKSNGTFRVSGTGSGIVAVTTTTITSAIAFNAYLGREVTLVKSSTDADNIIYSGVSIVDSSGSNTYVASSTTISSAGSSGSTAYIQLSKAMASNTSWTSGATLSSTFSGSSGFGNQITGVANASTLYQVGAVVYNNQYIPDNTTITGISGTTITLSGLLNNPASVTGATFKISSNLSLQKTYQSINTSPLPCVIPSGATLWISVGSKTQQMTVGATGNPGDTSLTVSSFRPNYPFPTTSYTNGVVISASGDYGGGAQITVGLNQALQPGQVIIFNAGTATTPAYTDAVTVLDYAPISSRYITIQPHNYSYPYDGQNPSVSFTASTVAGSNTITAGSTTNLAVGQLVFSTDIGTNNSYAYITAISGTTVTLSTAVGATNASSAFTVYASSALTSLPFSLDTGSALETCYPISLPPTTQTSGSWTVSLGTPLQYSHKGGVPFTYYQYPTPANPGDVTYRPDLDKFQMFDGFQWRTARVNSVSTNFSLLGSVGGGDQSFITLYDPNTNTDGKADQPKATGATGYSTYSGAARSTDPNGDEWTADTLGRAQVHLSVKVPQSSSVGYRSVSTTANYRSEPLVSKVAFAPGDNFIISRDTDNFIIWTYDDFDGENQTGWEVRIFDDATYRGGNFDPNKSTPVWKDSGSDNSYSTRIMGDAGFANGRRYWVYVRVAKQFQGKQWWGDWSVNRFTANTTQPNSPIMSINTDTTNAVNNLVIQATDNLLGSNNGSFSNGAGQWAVGSNDNVGTGISALIDGMPLTAALSTSSAVSYLNVGATGYLKTAIGTTNATASFVVSNTSAGGNAKGFPTSDPFWVSIGSEKILVKNNADGKGSGDTFTILQRGYKGTVAATHSIGSAPVVFPLQNDLYVGTTLDLVWEEQYTKRWNQPHTSVVAWSNGHGAYTEPGGRYPLTIIDHGHGRFKSGKDHIVVNDPHNFLSWQDVGSTILLSFKSYDEDIRVNNDTEPIYGAAGADGHASIQSTGGQTVKRVRQAFNKTYEVEMKITAIHDLMDNSEKEWGSAKYGNGKGCLQAAKVTSSVVYGGTYGNMSSLNITTVPCDPNNSWSYLGVKPPTYFQAGTVLYIHYDTQFDDAKKKTIGPGDLKIVLTADWNASSAGTQNTIKFRPIKSAPGFTVGDGTLFKVPAGAKIYWWGQFPTSRKAIHFEGKYTDKVKAPKPLKLHEGDTVYLIKSRTIPAVKATASGTTNVTTYKAMSKLISRDNQQAAVVDFSTQPAALTNGVLGNLSGTTFTTASSTTAGTYNSVAFSAVGATASVQALLGNANLPTNSFVASKTTITAGITAGWVAVKFKDISGNSVNVTAVPAGVTGATTTTVSSYHTTDITATFTQVSSQTISAGATQIPVIPFTPKFKFPQYTPIRFHYPTLFGDYALVADPTSGTGQNTDISEITLYPANWATSDENPVAVRAGTTYGLVGYSKVVTGLGTPFFAPFVDWYDSVGSKIKTSDGRESLTSPGTTNSVTIGATLNANGSIFGSGWTPVAMVAKAPQNFSVGTVSGFTTGGTTGTGTFNISSATIAVNAGATLTDAGGNSYTTTTSTAIGATQIPVRYTGTITASTSGSLTINASYAVPRFQWQYASSGDAYGLCGVLFQAMTAPSAGSNSVSSTQLPTIGATMTVATGKVVSALALPNTTVTTGLNSLYVFDPVGDKGTREIVSGGGDTQLSTTLTSSASVGSTSLALNSVAGLAAGSTVTLDYNGDNQETVTIASTWDGTQTVPIANGVVNAHTANTRVFAPTAGLGGEIQTTQASGTPVAVFNWSMDGYLTNPVNTYQYKVEKSEDNGTTWTTLRNGGSVTANASGVATVTDYEAVLNTAIQYRVTPTLVHDPAGLTNDFTISGYTPNPVTANKITTNSWWLGSTSDSSLRYPVLVQNGYSETQRHPSGVFYPLGSTRPITVAGVPTGRDGSITIIWTDLANFQNFLNLLKKGEVMTLMNPVEGDRKYIFLNQDISITHQASSSPYREISLSYVEAAPPDFGYTYGS